MYKSKANVEFINLLAFGFIMQTVFCVFAGYKIYQRRRKRRNCELIPSFFLPKKAQTFGEEMSSQTKTRVFNLRGNMKRLSSQGNNTVNVFATH